MRIIVFIYNQFGNARKNRKNGCVDSEVVCVWVCVGGWVCISSCPEVFLALFSAVFV